MRVFLDMQICEQPDVCTGLLPGIHQLRIRMKGDVNVVSQASRFNYDVCGAQKIKFSLNIGDHVLVSCLPTFILLNLLFPVHPPPQWSRCSQFPGLSFPAAGYGPVFSYQAGWGQLLRLPLLPAITCMRYSPIPNSDRSGYWPPPPPRWRTENYHQAARHW